MDRSPKAVFDANNFVVYLGAALLGGLLATAVITGVVFMTLMALSNLTKLPLVDIVPIYSIPLMLLASTGLIHWRYVARLEVEYLVMSSVIGFTMTGALVGLFTAVAINGGLMIVIQCAFFALAIGLLSNWAHWHCHQGTAIEIAKED